MMLALHESRARWKDLLSPILDVPRLLYATHCTSAAVFDRQQPSLPVIKAALNSAINVYSDYPSEI